MIPRSLETLHLRARNSAALNNLIAGWTDRNNPSVMELFHSLFAMTEIAEQYRGMLEKKYAVEPLRLQLECDRQDCPKLQALREKHGS